MHHRAKRKQLLAQKKKTDNKQLPYLCKGNEKLGLTIYNTNITGGLFHHSTYDTHYKTERLILSQRVRGDLVQINPPLLPQSCKKLHRSQATAPIIDNLLLLLMTHGDRGQMEN